MLFIINSDIHNIIPNIIITKIISHNKDNLGYTKYTDLHIVKRYSETVTVTELI